MAQRLAPSKPTDPMLGRVIAGRYRLEARIGEGGMGVVYRARHVLIDRVVAVKLIRPDLRGETHLRAWMLREARAANRVDHAHIIDIHDIGETEEGELYLVMEYLVGTSLSSELARGPMPLARGVDILEQMCAALARAHDLGVVHRDLKSDNILLTTRGGRKDFVKILDFGLAHLAMDPRLAPKGAVFGTPEYMSPEQARGEEATAQSDLYALGVLFFEMLTGQLPFRSDDRETLLEMQRTAVAPQPRSIKPDVLARRRGHRPQAPREGAAQALPGRAPSPRGAQGAPAQPPEHAVGDRSDGRERRAAARRRRRSRRASSSGRAAPRSSRAWCRARTRAGNPPAEVQSAVAQAWDLASRASRLEGEVASHTRKLEALERRGRALRAEIGRKVEELAHEESRALRELAAEQDEVATLARGVAVRPNGAQTRRSRPPIRRAAPTSQLRAIFERAGAAVALVEAKREQLQGARAEGDRQRRRRRATSAAKSRSSAPSSRATPRRSKRTCRAAARRSRRARAKASRTRRRSARCRRSS